MRLVCVWLLVLSLVVVDGMMMYLDGSQKQDVSRPLYMAFGLGSLSTGASCRRKSTGRLW